MAFAEPPVGLVHPSSPLQEHLWLVMALPSHLSVPTPENWSLSQGRGVWSITSPLHSARITGMLEEKANSVHSQPEGVRKARKGGRQGKEKVVYAGRGERQGGREPQLIRPHVQSSIWLQVQQFPALLELSWRRPHDPPGAEALGQQSRCTLNIF